MKSKKYEEIVKSVGDSIVQGKHDSLLNRMQFDYEIRNTSELSNYLTILLTIIERGNYEISNNIFQRKIINSSEVIDSFIGGVLKKIELIKVNSVFPFVNISNSIASIIVDLIDNSENAKNIKDKIPEKYFLFQLNFDYLKMHFSECGDNIVFSNYIRLLYNCIYDINQTSREVQLFNESTQFLKKILSERKNVFNNYLQHFLRSGGMRYSVPNVSRLQIVPEPYFEEIFGSIEEFEILLERSDSILKDDIKKFLSEYKVNRKVFIEDLSITKSKHEFLKKET